MDASLTNVLCTYMLENNLHGFRYLMAFDF
jgi:hypothetical protein